MASTAKPASSEAAPLQSAASSSFSVLDVVLRMLVLAAAVCAVVVMVTSKQTEMVPVPGLPPTFRVPYSANFDDSPAFVYFVAALSVTGLYSIITTLASISLVRKPSSPKALLVLFTFFDAVFVGITASATGTAGAVAYIGLKGNDHVRWNKVCNIYDKFCRHIGSAVALSLFASILLVLLTVTSTFTLYKKAR